MGGEGQWQAKHAYSQGEAARPGKAGTEVPATFHFASKVFFANIRHQRSES